MDTVYYFSSASANVLNKGFNLKATILVLYYCCISRKIIVRNRNSPCLMRSSLNSGSDKPKCAPQGKFRQLLSQISVLCILTFYILFKLKLNSSSELYFRNILHRNHLVPQVHFTP